MNKNAFLSIALLLAIIFINSNAENIDLPKATGTECVNESYFHDEAQHLDGYCLNDCQCDGLRRCENSVCVGDARIGNCLSENYFYDERKTGNQCNTNCQCDGMRKCSTAGWCHGTARYANDWD